MFSSFIVLPPGCRAAPNARSAPDCTAPSPEIYWTPWQNTVPGAGTEKAIARSYAYGFILHYALDRQCHPFVYAKQQELADSGAPAQIRPA